MLGLVGGVAPRDAQAQVSDEAQCGTSLPACTTLRTNCCTRDFVGSTAQKAVLIPVSRCHQPFVNGTNSGGPDVGNAAPKWCSDNPTTSAMAMTYAYGLVYRLMQNKIPVYWIVNPTKAPSTWGINSTSTAAETKDVDFWVLSSAGTPPSPTGSLTAFTGTSPIKRLTITNPGTAFATLTTAATYSKNEFPLRGGAFMIAPDDRPAFDLFIRTQLGRSTCGSGRDCYDFRDVYLYELDPTAKLVWQDYTQPLSAGKYYEFSQQVPVAMRIDYQPPKVAVGGGSKMTTFLAEGNLNDLDTSSQCKDGNFQTPMAVGCQLSESDINNDKLAAGSFNNAWIDLDGPSSCTTFLTKLQNFATAVPNAQTAGNIIFFSDSISVAEQCTGKRGGMLGLANTGLSLYGSSINESNSTPFIVRYPANLFSQYGDLALDFSSGNVKGWDRRSGTTGLYSATFNTAPTTLRRLITQETSNTVGSRCANHKDLGVTGAASSATCDDASTAGADADFRDLFAYGRYLNTRRNGLVFYSPGNQITQNGQKAHMKLILSTLVAIPPFVVDQIFTNLEVTRASPVVATVNGQEAIVQGSYEYRFKTDGTTQYQIPRTISGVYVADDVANFTFPAFKGHLRATTASSITTTAGTLSAGTVLFDAGADNMIPPVAFTGCATNFDGSCRTVWTTIAGGLKPDTHFVHEGNHATVGAAMLPESSYTEAHRRQFIQRILKGYDDGTGYVSALGGIDRSTVAVIGPGASVGGSRPTIAYVGSADGMLHAICASIGPGCTSLGQELWAYIPRVNLSTLRYNTARIDGSPRVLDVRADFYGTGSTYKTVLIFQTGGGDPTKSGQTPAVYALDVTNPSAPRVIWEYTTPTVRSTYELGNGLTVAAGEAIVGTAKQNLVVVQTNNGGSGGPANVITAIDTATGTRLWQFANLYPNPPRVATSAAVPASGLPPGVTTIDKTVSGSNAFFTHIVAGDLYGNLWVIDPATGTSSYKNAANVSVPLFRFTTDFRPITKPAIYLRNGEQFAVFTTGGYADYSTTRGWGTYAATQYLVAVGLNTPSGTTSPALPLTELSSSAFVPINQVIAGRGFGQARIVGDEVFVTTDTSDVNAATFGTSGTSTGTLYAYDFAATSSPLRTTVVATGAAAIANSGNKLYSSSGSKRQRATFDAKGVVGQSVTAPEEVTTMIRKLWLRTE
ncbi:MAG: hypothetical protein M3680_06225 [Myxococcota bacterium]|nr:hypothetical protein [Myxococcota bacterium]